MPKQHMFTKIIGSLIWLTVAVVCLSWPFLRPSNDFDVFYVSWRTVLEGKGLQVYQLTPDRYLYAPGFAWFFAPLGIFSRSVALGIWSLAKFTVIAFCAREFAKQSRLSTSWTFLGFGLLVVLRPLMIDFQYGQVNAFLFFLAAWALLRLFLPKKSRSLNADSLVWFFFGVFSIGKLITLPLLVIPFFLKKSVVDSKHSLRCATAGIAGAFTVSMLPVLQVGLKGQWHLHLNWLQSLQSRGFPLESHNQSIPAILQHWLSGVPIRVIVLYQQLQLSSSRLVSEDVLKIASYVSAFFWLGGIFYLAWIFLPKLARSSRADNDRFIVLTVSLLIALMMMPSHLIWKPYFISGLPLVWALMSDPTFRKDNIVRTGLVALLALLQFTGVDFIGPAWAGWLEAGGVLMAAHLILLALGVYRLRTLLHETARFDSSESSR